MTTTVNNIVTINLDGLKTIYTDLLDAGKLEDSYTLRYCTDEKDILGFYARLVDSTLTAFGIEVVDCSIDPEILNGKPSKYSTVVQKKQPNYGLTINSRELNDIVNDMVDNAYKVFKGNDALRLKLIGMHDKVCNTSGMGGMGGIMPLMGLLKGLDSVIEEINETADTSNKKPEKLS